MDAEIGGTATLASRAGTGPQGGVVVYDGRMIGFLLDRQHGVDAITGAGKQLGRFNDPFAAARALIGEAMVKRC